MNDLYNASQNQSHQEPLEFRLKSIEQTVPQRDGRVRIRANCRDSVISVEHREKVVVVPEYQWRPLADAVGLDISSGLNQKLDSYEARLYPAMHEQTLVLSGLYEYREQDFHIDQIEHLNLF